MGAKHLGLLNELIPNAALIALLVNPDNPNAEPEWKDIEQAVRPLGKRVIVVNANSSNTSPHNK
jgi:putative tryptophan/tyrosine transport system substrate-binding protein